ncbi:MAG: hypothetical protein LBC85_08450 [Fibromonadaceae bacterium]|jgi:hypothetical protein|nr:hypothetical protein [Fibromonadaceae bacterium]
MIRFFKILAFLALFCTTIFAQKEKNATSTQIKIFDRFAYMLVLRNIDIEHIRPMESLFVYLSTSSARSIVRKSTCDKHRNATSNSYDGLNFMVLPDKQGYLNTYLMYIKKF